MFERIPEADYFEPISGNRIKTLKYKAQQVTGIDFKGLPVVVARPGEPDFDIYEAQTKLYQKAGSWPKCVEILTRGGYMFDPTDPSSVYLIRRIAEEQGVVLDGTMPGFVYNIGGSKIIYMAVRDDMVRAMAEKYAKKEKVGGGFDDPDKARHFLEHLAEEYFFHELGHSVYLSLLPKALRDAWDEDVRKNRVLVDRELEV